VLSLAQRESVEHIVDPSVLIKDQVLLEVVFRGHNFLLENINSLHKSVFE
jgi:hypothetical protein